MEAIIVFQDIDMKKWKAEFHYKNTKESLLKLKYTNKWYFPLMFAMMLVLLFGFLIFVIGFFLLQKELSSTHYLYIGLIFLFIACWTSIYFVLQKRAIAPYSEKAEGYLVFSEKCFSIKKVNIDNVAHEHSYGEIKGIFFNRKTCGLALMTNKKEIIFNEIVSFEDVSDILNILYKMTKIKPKII